MNYEQMTATCGLPCFECALYLAKEDKETQAFISELLDIPIEKSVCKGCRNENGQCVHHDEPCRLYPCAEEKGLKFCYECSDFLCDYLHPYADKADIIWHNTKVFNLCLIKKMGLEAWAKNKAKNVKEVYYYGKWKL